MMIKTIFFSKIQTGRDKLKRRRAFWHAATGSWAGSWGPRFQSRPWCSSCLECLPSCRWRGTNWSAPSRTTWADRSSRCSGGRTVLRRCKKRLEDTDADTEADTEADTDADTDADTNTNTDDGTKKTNWTETRKNISERKTWCDSDKHLKKKTQKEAIVVDFR